MHPRFIRREARGREPGAMNTYHGTTGQPELDPVPGASFQLSQRYLRIDAQQGFRALDLHQVDGMVLALDWVVGNAHHIWGSAVLVAPGVALTARHVIDEMRVKGFLAEQGG